VLIRAWYKCMLLMAGLIVSLSASAHEFWLSPHSYAVKVGEQIIADIRVGENMKALLKPQQWEKTPILTVYTY